MRGAREDFETVSRQIDIETVADYLLKKQGHLYKFPGEKTASIKIYPESASFYDFGRGIGGDCIKLSSLARAKTKLKQEKKLAGKSEGFGQNKAFYSYLLEQRT